MPNFVVGKPAPILGKKGKYVWIRVRTQAQLVKANRDFANAMNIVRQQCITKGTNAHPVLPETKRRNANQRTCNKISDLIRAMNLRF